VGYHRGISSSAIAEVAKANRAKTAFMVMLERGEFDGERELLDEPSHAEQTKGLSNRSEGVTYLLEGLGRSDIKKAGLNKEEERANRAGNPGLSLKDPDEENNAACLMPTSCLPHAHLMHLMHLPTREHTY